MKLAGATRIPPLRECWISPIIWNWRKRPRQASSTRCSLPDGPALADNIRYASRFRLEPLTWISALAAVTERIGFIATASTTYNEPYNLARLFASVDHLSGGRAGWNIVTTGDASAALNFGLDRHPTHADRYERASEFVDVVTKLWDSWEDDALVADRVSGIFADTDKIHPINHIGKYHRVKGPLTLPRSLQGRPVYVQAGSSEDGRSFASRYAEAIFTAHQTLGNAQEFYADIKARVKSVGRNPDHVKVLPSISPFIGSTEAEARALHDEFNELTQPEYSLHQLRRIVDADLSSYDLDGPFPRELIRVEGERGASSRFHVVLDIIERENPTIRQLLHRLPGRAAIGSRPGRPNRSPTRSRNGSTMVPRTALISCRPICRAGSTYSPRKWCRSCASADFSGTTMTGQR